MADIVMELGSHLGMDYPLIAMTAARLGKPEKAIDALFMDVQKNTYLKNGHNIKTADYAFTCRATADC